MHRWIIAVVLIAAPGLLLAQGTAQEKKLHLLCEGVRESGYLLDDNKKRENVTLQLTVFLPSGFFEADGLPLSAHLASQKNSEQYSPPQFKISDDSFYFRNEITSDKMSMVSKFSIDRYSGRADEAQLITSVNFPGRDYVKNGSYQCRQIKAAAF